MGSMSLGEQRQPILQSAVRFTWKGVVSSSELYHKTFNIQYIVHAR